MWNLLIKRREAWRKHHLLQEGNRQGEPTASVRGAPISLLRSSTLLSPINATSLFHVPLLPSTILPFPGHFLSLFFLSPKASDEEVRQREREREYSELLQVASTRLLFIGNSQLWQRNEYVELLPVTSLRTP